jgi:hypothetical protein
VATRISELSTDRPIVEENGSLTLQSRAFFRTITQQALIIGSGNPEGVVEGEVGSSYLDSSGVTGAILYIKRDSDDGVGDKSIGWILV